MPHKWWVLAAVACGTFMATLDSSIVNIALPTLTKELATDLYRTKWVVIIYLLVINCLLLPFGRLSDQHGRKRIFLLGFIAFTLGSVACGFAPSLTLLLAARAFQAIGGSMLMANGPAVITAAFPAGERGKALGTLAMVVSAGLISGPSIGGLLISGFGWPSIFLVNVPIGLLGLSLGQRFIPKDAPVPHKNSAHFDWTGMAIQTILLVSFMIVVDPPSISVSGSVPFPVSRLAVGFFTVALAVLFVKVESEAKAPLFDLSLLRSRTFWTANLAGFLTFVAYSSLAVLMPFFLEEVLHFAPNQAGLFMTAIPLTIFVVAPIAGRLSDRLGSQELSFAGALVGAIGLFLMSGAVGHGMHENMSHAWIVLGLCSMGLSTGLFQSPNNNAIMGAVPPNKLGVASALMATVRNLGMMTGTGMATGLFSWQMTQGKSFVASLHFALFVAAFVSVGAMLASLARKRGPNTH